MEERVHLFLGEETKLGIVCECDDAQCEKRLIITVSAYERVRSDPLRFFTVPGHEDPRIEQVMEQTQTYLVVRKTGEAAKAVEDTAGR